MIYLDTSVALAQLLAEDRCPPTSLWDEPLVSSRLLQYEVWTRIHSRKLARSHGQMVRSLLDRVAFIELAPPVLERALEPFPIPVRTLDALHLASLTFLADRDPDLSIASYDQTLVKAAKRLGVSAVDL